jgi:hypothetical protein
MKSRSGKRCLPSTFTASPFRTVRTWKQPTYLSSDKQIKKMWYRHTQWYYSVCKKENPTFCDMNEPRGCEISRLRTNTIHTM